MRRSRLTAYALAALACSRQLHGAPAAFELESPLPQPLSSLMPLTDGCIQWQISHDIPNGLRELAGHRLVLNHIRRSVAAHLSLSLRGPARYRESALSAGGSARLPLRSIASATLTKYRIDQGGRSRHGWGKSLALEMVLRTGVSLVIAGRGTVDPFVRRRLDLRVVRWWGNDSATVTLEKHPGRSSRIHLTAAHQIDQRLRLRFGTSSVPRQFAAGAVAGGATQLQYLIRTHAPPGADSRHRHQQQRRL